MLEMILTALGIPPGLKFPPDLPQQMEGLCRAIVETRAYVATIRQEQATSGAELTQLRAEIGGLTQAVESLRDAIAAGLLAGTGPAPTVLPLPVSHATDGDRGLAAASRVADRLNGNGNRDVVRHPRKA